MITRRTVLTAAGLLGVSALSARVRGACSVFTKTKQAAMTPEQALARLKEGNARFVAGGTIQCDLREQVKATASGQAPFAAILGCMDSRVPPELVFDQAIGDIFAVRIAGNFVNTDILGSLEYATQVAGAKLIVVLGHTDCGAVKGAIEEVKLGNLTAALANIRPAILEVTDVEGPHDVHNKKFLQAVTERNATYAAALLTARSEVLGDLVGEHRLMIASAVHDVSTGAVAWLGNLATGKLATGNPATGEPATGNPATGNPATGNPATGEPATGEPVSGSPATGKKAAGSRRSGNAHVFRDPEGDKACAGPQDHDRHCTEER